MNKFATLAAVALTLAFNVACESQQPGPDVSGFTSSLPDQRILINMPTDDGSRNLGDVADTYIWTRNATRDVNGIIEDVLTTINTITDFEPTFTNDDNEYLWGPWNDGGLDPNETALYVRHNTDANSYSWALIQRPKESTSDDDWIPVIAGESNPGATEDVGDGFFIVDFDTLADLNPDQTATGIFSAHYNFTDNGLSAEVAFADFSEDSSQPQNAIYVYDQHEGAGSMDLILTTDFEEGTAQETIVLRTRWTAEGEGRGDMVVFGGDLGVLVVAGSQCWDSSFASIYEAVSLPPTIAGEESDCAFSAAEWSDDAPES